MPARIAFQYAVFPRTLRALKSDTLNARSAMAQKEH
jgi:hypothetical protein